MCCLFQNLPEVSMSQIEQQLKEVSEKLGQLNTLEGELDKSSKVRLSYLKEMLCFVVASIILKPICFWDLLKEFFIIIIIKFFTVGVYTYLFILIHTNYLQYYRKKR